MSLLRKLEVSLVIVWLLTGVAFLLLMCHLSFALNAIFGIVFLTMFYVYVRKRHRLGLPPTLLVLVYLALLIDALGNLFGMYGSKFGPLQFDEFSHLSVQILVSPILVWLTQKSLEKMGHRLELALTAFFAATTMFSISAAYEIIELWDHLYFHPGRIWSPIDTATDLQFDLVGIVVGTLLACLMLRVKMVSNTRVDQFAS